MTGTYDPNLAEYLEESSVRLEMARSFQVCAGCGRCMDFCPSFRNLSDALQFVGNEADRMTPYMQDQIADPCFDCGRCLQGCPHSMTSGVDVPALMLRHRAMAREHGLYGLRHKVTEVVRVRRDALRRIVQRVPRMPHGAEGEFLEWFHDRPRIRIEKSQGRVAIIPACDTKFDHVGIGRDLVKVLEHNGLTCALMSPHHGCGEDLLRIGDIGGFTRVASRNVREWARAIDEGNEIVVLSAHCLEVIRNRYPEFVGGPETSEVVGHTFGPTEFLIGLRDRQALDVQFPGDRPESVEYRASCPARNTGEADAGGALLRLAGIAVSAIDSCCGGQGCRESVSIPTLSGESAHPVQFLARAYGLARD